MIWKLSCNIFTPCLAKIIPTLFIVSIFLITICKITTWYNNFSYQIWNTISMNQSNEAWHDCHDRLYKANHNHSVQNSEPAWRMWWQNMHFSWVQLKIVRNFNNSKGDQVSKADNQSCDTKTKHACFALPHQVEYQQSNYE